MDVALNQFCLCPQCRKLVKVDKNGDYVEHQAVHEGPCETSGTPAQKPAVVEGSGRGAIWSSTELRVAT